MNISSINERLNSTIQYEKILGDCRSCSKRFCIARHSFVRACVTSRESSTHDQTFIQADIQLGMEFFFLSLSARLII